MEYPWTSLERRDFTSLGGEMREDSAVVGLLWGWWEGKSSHSPLVYFQGGICMYSGVRDMDVKDSPLCIPPDCLLSGNSGGLGVR